MSSSSSSLSSTDELERELQALAVEGGELKEEEASSSSSGGFLFTDVDEIKKQRRSMLSFVKEVGKSVLLGKDLVSISLPVAIFEPRSFLERLTDNWSFISFLRRAAEERDPVERLKYVVCFVIAGLRTTTHHKKPFNPILGETYQAEYQDGTRVFCEQTSHHPPVSHFVVEGADQSFRFTGYGQWSASFSVNSVKGQQSGPNRVEFADGSVVSWQLPYLVLRGVLWGSRVMDYCGSVDIVDETNNLRAELKFDPDKPGLFKSIGNFFTGTKRPASDLIRGEIVMIAVDSRGREQKQALSKVEGSWLTHIEFTRTANDSNFIRYWDLNKTPPETPVGVEDPLPSDSRFREDLVYLKAGDIDSSQKWKVELEEKQRHERKLRKESGKKK